MRQIPLFDLGNVVIQVDFRPFLRWLSSRAPLPAEKFLQHPLFLDFEFGRLSPGDFAERVGAEFGVRAPGEELLRRFCEIFPGPVDGMPELLAELSARGPVYALSNTNELHLRWLREHHPGLLLPFTGVFASHELRLRKPDPEIYLRVARELAVPPGRLLFFDDLPANVEAARAAGLDAHLFVETGGARSALKRFPGLVDKP